MSAIAQEYNAELNDLGRYVQRMYMNEPFEGARIVEDVDNCYLITVVAEKAGNNDYATNRKAEVKGLSYANTFLNGAQVSQNTILHTRESSNGYSYEEIEDFIESRSCMYIVKNSLCRRSRKARKIRNIRNEQFVFCPLI